MKNSTIALVAVAAVGAWFLYRRVNADAAWKATMAGSPFGPSRFTTIGGNTYVDGQLVYT
ncbi:hypothetical protein [Aquabacterium sp.]|uniref:hypothetical protein n=1 Tax=Aquabacterium sp. TaxID=1872578 RepID=UPI0025C16EDA|nr:hypothetical protein [Aquabacterium sp.]